MKTIAFLCNVILFLFTIFVIGTDGTPQKSIYILFTLLILATLILSAMLIYRLGIFTGRSSENKPKRFNESSSIIVAARTVAIILNILVIGFLIWALIDQYPHPIEPGFIEFVVLMLITPILNLTALIPRLGRNNIHIEESQNITK